MYDSMGEDPKNLSRQENTKAVNNTVKLRMAERENERASGHISTVL